MGPDYYLGLDLGPPGAFTALAVVERPPAADDAGDDEPVYALRHLRRWAPGTPYAAVVRDVVRLAGTAPLRGCATLVVDQTGVGSALAELLRAAAPAPVVPVTVTAGHAVTAGEDGAYHVPRKELVTGLQLLLQGRRLRVARALPDVDVLLKELGSFRAKVTSAANEAPAAWREGVHDDLVLAVGLACWQAEREPRWHAGALGCGRDGLVARLPAGVFRS